MQWTPPLECGSCLALPSKESSVKEQLYSGETGRHHLNQVTKASITSDKIYCYYVSLMGCDKKSITAIIFFPPKISTSVY